MQSNKPYSATKMAFAIFVAFLLASLLTPAQSQAQKFKVLHTFRGKDGGAPYGLLVVDAAGNLYGTTGIGATGKCGSEGCGTVFKLTKSGEQVWLHSFNGTNGWQPMAGLLRNSAGDLFGTTVQGGITSCGEQDGCGTVFELNKAGKKETVLHKFGHELDGFFPESPLAEDAKGNLYGTTHVGGEYGVGLVFRVDRNGNESVLYSFTGGSDGCSPYAGVTLDSAGNLYGVTAEGGDGFCNNGLGVVYELDTAGNETVLHTFTGGDGADPESVLLSDSKGNLYGTTGYGGTGSGCGSSGCGTVFELSPQSGGEWSEKVLYSFCSLENCADGQEPSTELLSRDSRGNLYGTTLFGGAYKNCDGDECGVVFKLDTAGKETVLHSFTGGADGAYPIAGVAMDAHGNLYGATEGGGASCYGSLTCGVVFEITP
jgi:uncharacterized repeat protein (TIGR03803 family)